MGKLPALEKLEKDGFGRGQESREGRDNRPFERAGLHEALDLVEQELEVEGDHQLRFAVLHLEGQFVGGIERVIVNNRAACLECGEIVNNERWAIGHEKPNFGASFDTELLQTGGGPFDKLSNLSIGEPFAEEIGAHPATVGGHRRVEQLAHWYGSKLLEPIDIFRVFTQPLVGCGFL